MISSSVTFFAMSVASSSGLAPFVDHDGDDIGALYILHGAVQRGEAELLVTLGCTSSDAIAPPSPVPKAIVNQ